MTDLTIYQDSFPVSGIMCHTGCGSTIRAILANLNSFHGTALLPDDADLTINAEPQGLGLYRVSLSYTSKDRQFRIDKEKIASALREQIISCGFSIPEGDTEPSSILPSNIRYWFNLGLSALVIILIIALTFFLPPSLPLTISLVSLSLLTAGFTARQYLINFLRNLRYKQIDRMGAPISLGWLLTVGHSIYHAVHMPLMTGISMIFMNLIMPVGLMAIINGMDIIKNSVMRRSLAMQLNGLSSLFPELSSHYAAYRPTLEEINQCIADDVEAEEAVENWIGRVRFRRYAKGKLKKQMVICVKRGECFPVDGIIIQGTTRVDASILTGEPQQNKTIKDFVPAGAINLGSTVAILAKEDTYDSSINKMLFRANRALEPQDTNKSKTRFGYFYFGLFVLALVTAIAVPAGLGLLTIPLILQNVMGILFAICPCTIAIAHELPSLLSHYHRNRQGITLRNKALINQSADINTVVFDKTGTLTTGKSQVISFWGLSEPLWERIYLLEKKAGAEHPLARAIIRYFESEKKQPPLIRTVSQVASDSCHRGLSGYVQGRSIQLGSLNYLQDLQIKLPDEWPEDIQSKLNLGFTPVYVAEDGVFKGIIFIRHQIRPRVISALRHLKAQGKRIIMLTGDNRAAAEGFNQQHGHLFENADIYANQTPQDKEARLTELFDSESCLSKGVWFVGDGLNDAPCARLVSEKGGVSCSMTAKDKAAYFTDLSLNGSIRYLFIHQRLNNFLKKITNQNKGILVYSIVAFLTFLVTFSIAGISVSPIIPMAIMVITTCLVIFNSYRTKWATDNAFAPKLSLLRHFMASDLTLALILLGLTLLITGVLIATLLSGGLAFPAIVFAGSAAAIAAGACVFAAMTILGTLMLAALCWFISDKSVTNEFSEEAPNEPVTLNEYVIPNVVRDLPIQAPSHIQEIPHCIQDDVPDINAARSPEYRSHF